MTSSSSQLDDVSAVAGAFSLSDEEFGLLRRLIHQETGIFLGDHKRQLVVSRLSKRLRHHGFQKFSQYYQYLTKRDAVGQEMLEMINCITTNKTDFFRESHHFDFLQEHLQAQAQARTERGEPTSWRIWCAASSSGEEPYSIAMTVLEVLGAATLRDVKILASDIDTNMLKQAQSGTYGNERVEGLPPPLLHKYFLRGVNEWQGTVRVKPEVRQLVTFRRVNLIESPWPFQAQFDAIFCRNVVIYFNRDTQRRLFERMTSYLKKDGLLFVGHSESLFGLSDLFVPVGGTIYRLRSGKGAP